MSRIDSVLGPFTSLEAEVESRGGLRIDCRFKGTLTAGGLVVVGQRGQLEGPLRAGQAQVAGLVCGPIEVGERLELLSTARVMGDVRTPVLIVREGALLRGSVVMDEAPGAPAARSRGAPGWRLLALLIPLALALLAFGLVRLRAGSAGGPETADQTMRVITPTPGPPGLPAAVSRIPPQYLALYQEAAEAFDVDWRLLAAIGRVESDHGRDPEAYFPNRAGAQGPMQFIPATWERFRNASGSPEPEVNDPRDAIFAAADFLRRYGVAHDLERAIRAYNPAAGYVELVLRWARTYGLPYQRTGDSR